MVIASTCSTCPASRIVAKLVQCLYIIDILNNTNIENIEVCFIHI